MSTLQKIGPVIITGHTGFKGTWLMLLMAEMGIKTHGISLPALENSLYVRANLHGKFQETFLDLRDHESVSREIKRIKPTLIIHLAAKSIVLESYSAPREVFETNVMGTVNILNESFENGIVKSIVCATTDKVYRNHETGFKFSEGDALQGKDPYSASKVGCESAISAWQQIQQLYGGPRITAVRAGNVIGGGDYAKHRLIPDIIKGIELNEKIEIRNPGSTRPWQHVLDPLVGYLMVLSKSVTQDVPRAVNFGPSGNSLSVKSIVEIAKKAFPDFPKLEYKDRIPDGSEAEFLELDSSLAKKVFDWEPKYNQENAVTATMDWYRKVHHESKDPLDVTLDDIREYLALLEA